MISPFGSLVKWYFRVNFFASEDPLRKIFQENRYEVALARKPVNSLPERATGLASPRGRLWLK